MVSTPAPYPWRGLTHTETTKRAFDVLVSSMALLVASPFMFLLALAIMVESGRPVFFSQQRLGQGGRPFRMYKFRKFRSDCGTSGSPLTVENDQRLTKVGKFLLATKMDELPQFWNVLKGDMSIIGPRPESMAFADCFSGGFERVLDYKPGILGPAQAAFRSECSLYPPGVDPSDFYRAVLFPAKARMDLEYYSTRTLASDIAWMLRTVLAVVAVPVGPDLPTPHPTRHDDLLRVEIETLERAVASDEGPKEARA